EQDIRKMAGIGRLMPWTRWAFLAGALALVGLPPFAGFFSKDSIIAAALHDHWYGVILAVAALAGTFLTGLYTFRLYFLVFPGEPSPFVREHHHTHGRREGPVGMLVPVAHLAVLSTIRGGHARRLRTAEPAGGDRFCARGHPRPRRRDGRLCRLRSPARGRAANASAAAPLRAQVLFRRGVRRALLQARRRARRLAAARL